MKKEEWYERGRAYRKSQTYNSILGIGAMIMAAIFFRNVGQSDVCVTIAENMGGFEQGKESAEEE